MSNDYTLPPVPAHPDWQVDQCNWLERERDAIASYGHAVAAPLLARIAEADGYIAEANKLLGEFSADRDRLRAENEALAALLTQCSDDLESEVEARRGGDVPRRIERDLEPVRKARELLAARAAR